jgi:hypothetical protein
MRYALVAVLALAGCPSDSSYYGGGGYGGGGGGGGYYPYPDGGGVFGSCTQDSDCNPGSGGVDAGSGGLDAGSGSGSAGSGSAGSGSAGSDAGAGGEVCARDGVCVPAADVITVHVKWTISGQPANATTCANNQSLELDFSGNTGYGYGYAPVPCVEGEFTITKLEDYYTSVQLGTQYDPGSGSSGPIPSGGGTVSLDLPY